MTSEVPSELRELRTRSPEELWGVSAESLYLSVCAVATDIPLTQALAPHYKTAVLRTNDERAPSTVADAHRLLQAELSLVTDDGRLTDRGRFVLDTEQPGDALRLVAATHIHRVQQLLYEFAMLDDEQLPRGELETLMRDSYDTAVIAPLLSSLDFLDLYPEGVILNREIIEWAIERLERRYTIPVEEIALTTALTSFDDTQLVARVASSLTDATVTAEHVSETTPLDAIVAVRDQSPTRTPDADILSAIEDTNATITDELTLFKRALDPSHDSAIRDEAAIDADTVADAFPETSPQADVITVLDLIATIHNQPSRHSIPLSTLSEEIDLEPYQLYQSLSKLPGVKCHLQDDLLIHFDAVPAAPQGSNRDVDFQDDLFEAIHTRRLWRDALSDVNITPSPRARDDVIERLLEQIDDDVIAPTYFVYTLPDPDALGQESMERYVDDNPALRRERARLKRWKNERSNDIRRFTEMTDRLFTRGQERDLEERVVRIMTPYDDDTFSEYTSQLRSLLRDGYELRLLTRHTKRRWEWERLRDNLLGDLEENRDKVTIRTYSRYKEYQRITSETDETDLAEFGIHAKLQTVGHASEGAALLGSANFMENSYNWNPECGIYTENANFVAAAINFFDHVWELSEADEVDLSNLQEIPKRSFYPSYYT